MNVFLFTFISWWKTCFLSLVNITGIGHGIFVGIFLSKVDTSFLKLSVIMGPFIVIAITIAAICRYMGLDNSTIEQKIKLYGVHVMLYGSVVDGIVTGDKTELILNLVFLGIVYILGPIAFAIGLSLMISRRELNPDRNLDVSGDYIPLETIEESEECTICLDPLKEDVVKLNNCSHVFHMGCIAEWLIRKRQCPICRERSESREPTEIDNLV